MIQRLSFKDPCNSKGITCLMNDIKFILFPIRMVYCLLPPEEKSSWWARNNISQGMFLNILVIHIAIRVLYVYEPKITYLAEQIVMSLMSSFGITFWCTQKPRWNTVGNLQLSLDVYPISSNQIKMFCLASNYVVKFYSL